MWATEDNDDENANAGGRGCNCDEVGEEGGDEGMGSEKSAKAISVCGGRPSGEKSGVGVGARGTRG